MAVKTKRDVKFVEAARMRQPIEITTAPAATIFPAPILSPAIPDGIENTITIATGIEKRIASAS